MKIHVESTEKNIHLSVPNQLIFNRLSASMIAKQIKLEDTFNLDKQTMKKMMKLLRKMTKKIQRIMYCGGLFRQRRKSRNQMVIENSRKYAVFLFKFI